MRSTPKRSVARHWLVAVVSAAMVLLPLVGQGCKNPYPNPRYKGAGNTVPRQGGVFRYAFDTDISSLDPHVGYDEISTAMIRMMFDTLVDYAPGSTRIVPSLAERYVISPDGKVFTFTLRAGVRFHNGQPLVALDVKKSFERMLDPDKVPCRGASSYHLLEGFDDFTTHKTPDLRGVVVRDEHTVAFHLTEADPTFLNLLCMPFAAPVPVEVAEKMGAEQFAQEPVGTGPFMIDRWEMGSRVVLKRNPHYWRPGQPYLDEIVLETGVARHLQFMRFQQAEIDHLHALSMGSADYLWIRAQPSWKPYILESSDISTYGVTFNVEMSPWQNVHLRRAFSFAINRDNIARARNWRIRPLGGLYPPGLPGYDDAMPVAQHYDLARAREEMALAGYPNGYPDELDFLLSEGDASLVYGQLIQADAAQIGIKLRLKVASFATYLDQTQKRHAVALSLGAWSQDYPDPANFIEVLFHTRSINENASENRSFYSNPVLDRLLDRAHGERDQKKRIAMYQQAERIVVDEAVWAFYCSRVITEVNQPYVKGYSINPVFSHDFRNVWFDLPLSQYAHRRANEQAVMGELAMLLPASLLP